MNWNVDQKIAAVCTVCIYNHDDTWVVNVIYYAMKNNRDRSMYELKMSGPAKDSTAIKDFLEGVMAGAAFVD